MTFRQDVNETPVVFRVKNGEIIAVFPCEPADTIGYYMVYYSVDGQHNSCSQECYNLTHLAKPEEYATLKAELETYPYGYRLKIFRKIPHHLHEIRYTIAKNRRKLVA